jgi:glycosyltransferase involved in cell wall biosynthesis
MPCLHTYHGHVLAGYFPPAVGLVVHLAERLLAGGGHHQALTPSQGRELALDHAIGRRGRWHVLPVPVARLPAPSTEPAWRRELLPGVPVIGFLGRLAPVKDLDLWLATLTALRGRRAVQGLVCGDGAERPRLEASCRAAGVPVRFTGFVPAQEALAAMDLLLLTSRNEGLPLVAVEAGGLGVPVVAPGVGGLGDLIRWGAVEGAPRQPAALADACTRLLDDPSLRRRRQASARALARRLEPAALAPAYARLYRAISGGAHAG